MTIMSHYDNPPLALLGGAHAHVNANAPCPPCSQVPHPGDKYAPGLAALRYTTLAISQFNPDQNSRCILAVGAIYRYGGAWDSSC